MEKRKWDEYQFGSLTFENICRLYSSDKDITFTKHPPFIRAYYAKDEKNQYAVRWNSYETGADFVGESNEAECFILSGECEITINGKTNKLRTGECFKLPKCKYQFKVIGHEIFEYVKVYKLSNDFLVIK